MNNPRIGNERPREPRDFYHLVRPNTAIWIGRVLPLMPWLYFPVRVVLDRLGFETNINEVGGSNILLYVVPFILQFMLLFGLMLPSSLKAGVFQNIDRQHMDEFDLRLVEKARLFAYRIMGVALLVIMFLSPIKGPIADWTGGPTIAGLRLAIFLLIIILVTVPVAYFHWSLKLVPADENIRPDPPFVPAEYAGMTFWQRFWRR